MSHSDRGWLSKLWRGAVLAGIGYMVGGLIGMVVWMIAVYDAPEGGTGNAAGGADWFGVGGAIGALALLGTSAALRHRRGARSLRA